MADEVTGPYSRWRKTSQRAVAAFGAAAALVVPAAAHAQTNTFYLDRLYMAGAPEDGIAPSVRRSPRRPAFSDSSAWALATSPCGSKM